MILGDNDTMNEDTRPVPERTRKLNSEIHRWSDFKKYREMYAFAEELEREVIELKKEAVRNAPVFSAYGKKADWCEE
tara:strand:- start:366 stop:596 length:231 start_codon:yes stop_codon:yes gene_type:complete